MAVVLIQIQQEIAVHRAAAMAIRAEPMVQTEISVVPDLPLIVAMAPEETAEVEKNLHSTQTC